MGMVLVLGACSGAIPTENMRPLFDVDLGGHGLDFSVSAGAYGPNWEEMINA
jgi:hypothetical protein